MAKIPSPLFRAISALGGVPAAASALGVSQQRLNYWLKQDSMPAEFCPRTERLTKGLVTCEELQPGVEWAVLRMQVEA